MFCKRAVLANVPSFWVLESRNIKNHRFLLPALQGMTFGRKLWYRGTSAKTKFLGTTLLRTPLRMAIGKIDMERSCNKAAGVP